MIRNISVKILMALCLLSGLFLTGCENNVANQILASNESQVQLRSFQSRAFDTTDKVKTLRTIISTLQDLGFVVEKADESLGTVTGVKFTGHEPLRMSVTVRPRGQKQLIVRANAQYRARAVEDPQPYQDFFNSLSKAMFLTAHEVD
jgi:hypothetical protein